MQVGARSLVLIPFARGHKLTQKRAGAALHPITRIVDMLASDQLPRICSGLIPCTKLASLLPFSNCVQAEAERRPGCRVVTVGVRIGALSNVDQDALDFAFEALTRDSDLEGLKLEIEWRPWRQKCLDCSEEYDVHDMDVTCPTCRTSHSTCVGGMELDVAFLELEEQPCAKP